MRLVWMPDPRPGEKVQCCKCYGMIDASEALADMDGKAGDLYHVRCVPKGTALPALTRPQIRAANKVYAQPVQWDAYMDVATRGKENEGVERKVVPVKAISRDQAFDKVRKVAIRYQRRYPARVVVDEAVPHKPRLSR